MHTARQKVFRVLCVRPGKSVLGDQYFFMVLLYTVILIQGLSNAAEGPIENLINVSWGDQIMVARGDSQLDEPNKIRRALKAWQQDDGGRTILWRGSSYYIKRYYERRIDSDNKFIQDYYQKVEEITKQFDPIRLVREETKKNDQKLLIYMTIYDHGAPTSELYGGSTPFPWQDRFTIEHPRYQTVDRQGNYHYGVLEMAYAESRQLMVDRIKTFVDEFDAEGVYVCSRTHSLPALHGDQFGFSEPVVAEYQKRYGINILQDARFDYQSDEYASEDEALENWRKLRGEYLTQFFRQLRQALPDKVIYAGIPRGRYAGPPYGNRYLDWESLVKERLVDGLVLGVFAGKNLHPPLYIPHAQIGYLSSEDDRIGIPSPEEAVKNIYGPMCQKYSVKLFFNSVSFGLKQRRWFTEEPLLGGFMIMSPGTNCTEAVIAHEDAFCGQGGSLTIEAWLYIDRLPEPHGDWPRILSKYAHSKNDYRGWEWMILPDGKFRYRVQQEDPTSPGGGKEVVLDSIDPLTVKKWFHLATVYDLPERQVRLYKDGKLVAHKHIGAYPMLINSGQDMYIGHYGEYKIGIFKGSIDELRFVSDAIRFTEIPKTPYTGMEPHTVALYHFDKLDSNNKILNTADANCCPVQILSGAAQCLTASKPGFKQALRICSE